MLTNQNLEQEEGDLMKMNSFLGVSLLFVLLLIPVLAVSQERLLIIAPDEFIDELEPLKRFKEASGRPTTLLSLSQVDNDANCTGVDQPERIKRCIAYYEDHQDAKFVMLVGDVDKFPVRWRWWGLPGQEYWGVSDLYYADLYKNGTKNFDTWDSNNNGLYGEIEFEPDANACQPNCRTLNNDHIDFLPDVSVGRIPASSGAEVTAYINKVIGYETMTNPSQTWFKTAGLYTGCWYDGNNAKKNEVGDHLKNAGFTLLPISEDDNIRYSHWTCQDPGVCCTPPQLMPATIVNDINQGLGFVNYHGHGNSDCMACISFCRTDVTGLTNVGKLPVVFAAACDTGMFVRQARFLPYIDTNGLNHCGTDNAESLPPGPYPHTNLPHPAPLQSGTIVCDGNSISLDPPCLAETFLFGNLTSPAGAIAYLGNRTNARGKTADLDRHFFEAYELGYVRLGDMWKYMMEQYYYQFGLANSHTWVRIPAQWEDGHTFDEPQKLILFGDPSVFVGGAFVTSLCGNAYDGNGGPLTSYSRYRVTCDVTVPTQQRLTPQPSSSVLFENGTKITALDSSSSNGLIMNATADNPIGLLGLSADPQSAHLLRGAVLRGQLRLRNGGSLKFY
jgi:hypothetical protein